LVDMVGRGGGKHWESRIALPVLPSCRGIGGQVMLKAAHELVLQYINLLLYI
jgi:hypothetical protein